MTGLLGKFSGRRRPTSPRLGRRFVPARESLEGRIAPANIAMVALTPVSSQNKLLTAPIHAGDLVYVRVDYTTLNIPSNNKYRARAIDLNATIDSNFVTYGSGSFSIDPIAQELYFPTVTARGGPEQISITLNPDKYFTEGNYNDNTLTLSINAVASPAKLVFNDQALQPPSTVTAGAGFNLTVAVEDTYNNVVDTDNGQVSVSILNNSGGSHLMGTVVVTASKGYASFTGLVMNKAGAGYTLALNRGGLTQAVTNAFAVVPTSATQLVIAPNNDVPAHVVAGANFGLTVSVEDPYGNVETTDNSTSVTASLASGHGPLTGGTSVTAMGGVVTFSSLIDTLAETITLGLSSGILPKITSAQAIVDPAAPAQLAIQTAPSSTGVAGQPFATQPVVREYDQYGNPAVNDNATVVTASPASGVGPLRGASAVVKGGVASFTALADTKAENLTINFRAGNGNQIVATSGPIAIAKATPTINWPTPAAIVAGTPLGSAQLDATATIAGVAVPGTFVYSPPSGTVLPAGSTSLSVAFTPTDASDNNGASGSTTIKVLVATTTSLTPSAAIVNAHQAVTFTAVVAATTGGASPVGSVSFLDGSTVLGSATLDPSGHATITTAAIPPGIRSITARYSGDPTNAPSASTVLPFRVRYPAPGDYDGSGKTAIAIYDQTAATFYITSPSTGQTTTLPYGNSAHTNIPIAGDFDGGGKADIAIYDQTAATFYVNETGGKTVKLPFGNPGHVNIPIAADFNGDGKTDFAIYDQTAAYLYVLESDGTGFSRSLGNSGHVNIPIAGDFDGDGKADVAIYDQTSATFYISESGGLNLAVPYGNPGHTNVPIAGDFDGDGKTDVAIDDQTAATLYVNESSGPTFHRQFGPLGDTLVPVVGDFNGDGQADVAVFDQSNAVFYISESGGVGLTQPFGNKKHANLPT
jgi:hypothetical protein